jgi:hypothetical protein
MNPIIEAKKPEIIALCRQYGVSRLDLFGSATGSAWDPDRSDFDFIVEFESYGPGIARRFVRSSYAATISALSRQDARGGPCILMLLTRYSTFSSFATRSFCLLGGRTAAMTISSGCDSWR